MNKFSTAIQKIWQQLVKGLTPIFALIGVFVTLTWLWNNFLYGELTITEKATITIEMPDSTYRFETDPIVFVYNFRDRDIHGGRDWVKIKYPDGSYRQMYDVGTLSVDYADPEKSDSVWH